MGDGLDLLAERYARRLSDISAFYPDKDQRTEDEKYKDIPTLMDMVKKPSLMKGYTAKVIKAVQGGELSPNYVRRGWLFCKAGLLPEADFLASWVLGECTGQVSTEKGMRGDGPAL